MKMFKRLAAVLLAGVMVLAMLTACGEKSMGQQFEDLTMEYWTLVGQRAGVDITENDKGLKSEIYEILGHIDPETGLYEEGYKLPENQETNTYMKQYMVVSNGAPMEITQKDIDDLQVAIKAINDAAAQASEVGTMKVGVATRVVGGKTYAGMIVEATRSAPAAN